MAEEGENKEKNEEWWETTGFMGQHEDRIMTPTWDT